MILIYRFRISALAALRSGDKFLALRNARQLKIAFESREKLTAYSDRVEETVRVISDAQSAKKVLCTSTTFVLIFFCAIRRIEYFIADVKKQYMNQLFILCFRCMKLSSLVLRLSRKIKWE